MYGQLKKDLVEILKKLCEMKQVQLIDGAVCKDHVHMYVAILWPDLVQPCIYL